MKKYIPHLIILLIIFFAGRFSKDDHSPEVEALRKKERAMFTEQIMKKQVEIQSLIEAQREIKGKMYADSLKFSEALNANKQAYVALKKKYNEINLNRATSAQLDSLVGVLFPN